MSAYEFWTGEPFWSTSSPVTWYFDWQPSFDDKVDYTFIMGELEQAFASWDAEIELDFDEASSASTADIVLTFASIDGIFGAIGQTYYPGSLIEFDYGEIYTWDADAHSQGSYILDFDPEATFYELALHEIGHAIGLDHATNDAVLMYGDISGSADDLTAGDIYGAQLLYGGESNSTRPDLDAVSVSLSQSSVASGGSVEISYSIANVGSSGVSQSSTGIYLSKDSIIGPDDYLLAQLPRGPLGADAAFAGNSIVNVSLPNGWLPGTYYIGAIADNKNVIREASEVNNSTSGQQITITSSFPDLTVSDVQISDGTPDSTQTIDVSFQVNNIGSGPAVATTAVVYLRSAPPGGSMVVARVETSAFAGSGYQEYSVSFSLAGLVQPGGKYSIFVAVDAEHDLVRPEINQSNNESGPYAIEVEGPAMPDLVANRVALGSSTLGPGATTTIHYTVVNSGLAASAATTLLFKLVNAAGDTWTFATRAFSELSPGASRGGSGGTAILPDDLPAGTYQVYAVVDDDGTGTGHNVEWNESNNVSPPFLLTITDPVTIVGTSKGDIIDPTHAPAGQPLPTSGVDIIMGNGGNDHIVAGGGGDWIDGGAGVDSMNGGNGDDTYVVDNAKDRISESGNDGTDHVLSSVTYSLLPPNGLVSGTVDGAVENLTLTGTKAINGTGNGLANVITGNSGNNILAGLGGADTLVGGGGTGDTATYAASAAGVSVSLLTGLGSGGDAEGDQLSTIENLTGSNFDDTLEGDAGNNVLAGGTNGALGDTVTYANATGGVKVSLASTAAQVTGGAGTDKLSGFENLIGSELADTLTGTSGANRLTGLGGADTLIGGAGADLMIGGTGNDTYVVDNIGDVADESGGNPDDVDTVQSSVAFSLLDSIRAIGEIENLTLTGSAAIAGTGNSLANVLMGNSGGNILTGLGGADRLDGGKGIDTMRGGTEGDTYVVDNAKDVVDETGGDGIDLVQSSVTLSLAAATVIAAVENLTLTGTGAINATGNGLENILTGNSGNNILAGLGGADVLDGGAGTGDTASYVASRAAVTISLMTGLASGGDAEGDTFFNIENLTGSNFDDTLEGNAGNNVLTGGTNGTGGDTVSYANALAGVKVSLASTAGQNTLGAGTDKLSGFENLTGSAHGDTLTGSSSANRLIGLEGTDTLTGGKGNDTFVFLTGFGADTITDFAAGAAIGDVIEIDDALAADFAALLAATTDIGSDLQITFGSDILTLKNIAGTASLDANDFLFV